MLLSVMRITLGIGSSGDEVNMPHYEEKGAGGKKGNSGIVFLPFEIINLASGWVGNPPFLNKTLFENQLKRDDIFAEINPKTASQYGLKEGSKITIRSSKGEIRARVHIFDGARPGIIFVPALGRPFDGKSCMVEYKGFSAKTERFILRGPMISEKFLVNQSIRIGDEKGRQYQRKEIWHGY